MNSSGLAGIALGAGSIWATDPIDGTVLRIEPGLRPVERTIPAGVGVMNITFGDGAVWTTNFINGTVSRIRSRDESGDTLDSLSRHAGGHRSAWWLCLGEYLRRDAVKARFPVRRALPSRTEGERATS